MIDPKELRLGNFIRFNEKFPDDPELELDNEGPMNEDDFNHMLIDSEFRKNAEAIPLTEEWLKRFGFKRQNNAWNGPHKNDFSLWNPPGEYGISLNDTIMCPVIEYVHQLQNLYFALTGEELTLKP
jgi:capsid portal protein